MSKRSASYFLRVLSVLVAPLVLAGLTASSGSAATATTPAFFGAKLTAQSQPSNAENGQSCDENGGIPHGSTCTWVAITAFENGSHFTAPRTGTVRHVKLVSCVKGKFRLQLARASRSARTAKIVASGPEISYAGQSPCGGASGDHYVVQSFRVKLRVAKGDYIAIKARIHRNAVVLGRRRLPPVRPAAARGRSAQEVTLGGQLRPPGPAQLQVGDGSRSPQARSAGSSFPRPRCRTGAGASPCPTSPDPPRTLSFC